MGGRPWSFRRSWSMRSCFSTAVCGWVGGWRLGGMDGYGWLCWGSLPVAAWTRSPLCGCGWVGGWVGGACTHALTALAWRPRLASSSLSSRTERASYTMRSSSTFTSMMALLCWCGLWLCVCVGWEGCESVNQCACGTRRALGVCVGRACAVLASPLPHPPTTATATPPTRRKEGARGRGGWVGGGGWCMHMTKKEGNAWPRVCFGRA